ncbi:MAG: hypothetical protein LBI94_08745 [Treponema sp.]|jgi:hypothetical protein|nr:hypothetical protein [Treponema sp.]
MADKKLVVGCGLWVMLVLGLALTGCTTFKATGLQSGLAVNGQQYEKAGYFSEKVWVNQFLGWPFVTYGGTLFNLTAEATDPNVKNLIETNIRKYGGDGVIDVEIDYGSTALQYILACITFGTWKPGTVTVSGTVVKAAK